MDIETVMMFTAGAAVTAAIGSLVTAVAALRDSRLKLKAEAFVKYGSNTKEGLLAVLFAFSDSGIVKKALKSYSEGMRLRKDSKSLGTILGVMKQNALDTLNAELIRAMCEDAGVGEDIYLVIHQLKDEDLQRFRPKRRRI